MFYPTQLLPGINYKLIDCDISELPLIRFIELKDGLDIVDVITGNIQLKYIADPTKHIADYSMNLLGIFEIEHLPITLTNEGKNLYNHYCLPPFENDTPIFPTHFELKVGKKYFTLKVYEINNLLIPYEMDGKILSGKCLVEHTPMKWNFWHFSIRWQNADAAYLHHENDKQIKKGWGRQLSSAARATIVQFATSSPDPEYNLIAKGCYINE